MNKCIACHIDTNNPRFCSRSCSATYNNILYPKRIKGQCASNILYTIVCPACQQSFVPKKSTTKYCSRKCNQKYRSLQFQNRVDSNGCFFIHTGNAPHNTKSVRKYLISKHGNKCMLCGQSGDDWKGKPLTLIVDHINGHADDWSTTNIQLICHNCDSQLSTYKGRNRGNSTRKYTITQK